jgi:hypothetical protein
MAAKEHPLLIHSFVLMAVGAAVVVWGVIGAVDAARSAPAAPAQQADAAPAKPKAHSKKDAGSGSGTAADNAQKKIAETQAEVAKTQSNVAALSQKPSLSNIGGQIGAAGQLAGQLPSNAGAYLIPILTILVGGVMVASGLFVLKRANWARYASFAMLAIALLYFAWLQSGLAGLGDPRNDVVLPIVAMLIVTLLASKFLWDLFVEKLEPA